MIDLDLAVVLVVLAGALAFVIRRLSAVRAAPPCHPSSEPAALDDDVVIGPALARGLRAADDRRRRPPRR